MRDRGMRAIQIWVTVSPFIRLLVEPNERNGLRSVSRMMVDKITYGPEIQTGLSNSESSTIRTLCDYTGRCSCFRGWLFRNGADEQLILSSFSRVFGPANLTTLAR